MKFNFFAIGLLIAGMLLTGCSDDDDSNNTPPPASREQLIVAKNWVLVALNVDPAIFNPQTQTQMSDLYPLVQPCERDNFTNFQNNGNYIVEEGATKCDPNDPNTVENGTYTWNTDRTVVVLNPAQGSSYEFRVVTLTSTEMVVEETLVEQNITYTITATYN